MGTQVATVASAIASHVHNLSAYEGAQVTNMFQRGQEFIIAVSEILRSIGSGHSGSI